MMIRNKTPLHPESSSFQAGEQNNIRSMKKRNSSGRGVRGFTITELLVAGVVTAIVIGATVIIYTTTIRAYRNQEMIRVMEERLRFGLEHLKKDISKAGFLATPNSEIDNNVCEKPSPPYYAVSIQRVGDTHLPQINANIQPSSITLFGAYASPNIYRTISIVGNLVTLSTAYNYPLTEAEFNQIFNNRHILRIVTKDQYEIYRTIASANYKDATLTLSAPVPVVEYPFFCGIQGLGNDLEVNVVNFIRYILRRDERSGAPLGKIDLVRMEIYPDGSEVIQSRLIISEFAIDLNFYDFVFDNDTTRTNPELDYQTYRFVEDVVNLAGSGILGTNLTARPQDLRSLTIKFSVRTENEDEDYIFISRAGAHSPIERYEVQSTMRGSARVMSAGVKIFPQSLSARNLK